MARWVEVKVVTTPEGLEPVADVFWSLGTGGVEIEDPCAFRNAAAAGDESLAPGFEVPAVPAVKAFFPQDEELEQKIKNLEQALSHLDLFPPPRVIVARVVAEEDWSVAWRAHYKPFKVGKRLVVKPAWEEFTPAADELIIHLEPGMAFGCGTHPTTAMCLCLLEEYVKCGDTVYDVGTGSGILAIAAALLGARRVVAVDVDEVAVRVARANVEANGLRDRVEVIRGNLLDGVGGRADLVLANIVADVIVELVPALVAVLSPGGRFIASGIIRERRDEVCRALRDWKLVVEKVLTEGEWVTLVAGVI